MTAAANSPLRTRLQRFVAPLLLGLVCLLVYNANLRTIGSGDTLSARYLPLVLWHDGTLELSAEARLVARGHPLDSTSQRPPDAAGKVAYLEPSAYWMMRTRSHALASYYPVVTPLLVAPLYLPAVAWLDAHGWEQPQVDRVAELMEKFAASILAAVASVLMYLVLRRDAGRWAVPLTLAFAFGTNTWMISSQALWQHGTAELLVALALLLVHSPASRLRLALLGAVCVVIVANRPPDAPIAVAFGLFVVLKSWRSAGWLVVGGIVPLLALLSYNLGFIGLLIGGYSLVRAPDNFLQHDWQGLAGLLVSPARGLLVFSPFLIFVPLGLVRRLRFPGSRALAVALGCGVLAQIVLYARFDWHGGECWGPRYMTDALPIFAWMIAPAASGLRAVGRGLLVLAMVASIGVQAIGAFWYTKTSDEVLYTEGSLRALWNVRNIPFLVELRHPPAEPELRCDAVGSIDRVGRDELPFASAPPRLQPGATIEGWALACGRSPAQLALLIDGIIVGTPADVRPRPDVEAAMHTDAPSGWRVSANLVGVPPGERVLQLAVRVGPRSDFRIVREQRVIVVAQ